MFPQMIHPADILMGDVPGSFQLVSESLNGLLVGGNLRLDEFEGNPCIDLFVEHLVDFAHTSFAELFDDLVSIGKDGPRGQSFDRCFQGFGESLGNDRG